MTGNIIDRFEVKGRAALEYGASGTVVVFQHSPELRLPNSGDPVLLVRSDGWLYSGKAEDVRIETATSASGLFLRNLTMEDVPIGSIVRWGDELRLFQSAVA